MGRRIASPEPRDGWFTSGRLRLHYLDWGGRGTPLLFLHGGSAHAHWWDFVAPAFTGAFQVCALDLRGHGDSDPADDGAYRIEDYASDVAAMIGALGLDRPVLVGHSLGSFVALRYALDRPGDLFALVMVDGRASFAASGSRYMKLLRALPAGEYASLDEAVRSFQPLPRETSADAEVLEHVARRSFRRDESGRWVAKFDRASLASHSPFDLRSRLGEIACPVLFVRGEQSRMLPASAAVSLAAACRHGAWIEIAGAHHHVPLDRPEDLAREIRRFLDGLGAGRTGGQDPTV